MANQNKQGKSLVSSNRPVAPETVETPVTETPVENTGVETPVTDQTPDVKPDETVTEPVQTGNVTTPADIEVNAPVVPENPVPSVRTGKANSFAKLSERLNKALK